MSKIRSIFIVDITLVEISEKVSEKPNIKPRFAPVIPLLGNYPKDSASVCTAILTVALFTVAKK